MERRVNLNHYYYKKREIDDIAQERITYISIDNDCNLYIGYDPISSVSCTSSKDIIQNGETITLSAIVKTDDDTPLEGVTVAFYTLDDT